MTLMNSVIFAFLFLAILTSGRAMELGSFYDKGSLLSIDGCVHKEPLPKNINCGITGSLIINDVHQYSLVVPEGADFSLDLVLVSQFGDVDLTVFGPNNQVWDSVERVGDDMVAIPETRLQPGDYTIQVVGWQTYSTYRLNLQTPSRTPQLAQQEVSLLASIFDKCCDPGDYTMSTTCIMLQKATAPNRTEADDLCSQPPNLCNDQGYLTKLSLSAKDDGNLACNNEAGGGVPPEFAGFKFLEALDLSRNSLQGNLSEMAEVVSKLPSLERLFLSRNSLMGRFDCSIIAPKLKVLWLRDNLLTGTLPGCLFTTSPSLEQVSLAGNILSGALPDIPEGSQLKLLDVSSNGAPYGPGQGSKGLTGPLTPSLSKVANLIYLDVSSNSFEGTLPAVPSTLEVLIASDNKLTGTLPRSLSNAKELRTLRASRNALTGSIPPDLAVRAVALSSLQLAHNQLEGPIDYLWNNPFLSELDVEGNKLDGSLPSKLARLSHLRHINLASNRFVGGLAQFAREVRSGGNSMVSLNLSGNALTGTLPDQFKGLAVFNLPASAFSSSSSVLPGTNVTYGFDVSNNRLNVNWPTWLLPALANLYPSNPTPPIKVVLAGGVNDIRCPQPQNTTVPSYMMGVEAAFNFSCRDIETNNTIRVTAALAPLATDSPAPAPGPSPKGADGSSSGGGSSIGVIGGAAGGGVVVVVIVLILALWMRRRSQTKAAATARKRVPLTFNQAFVQGNGDDDDDGRDRDESGGGAPVATPMKTWGAPSESNFSSNSDKPMMRGVKPSHGAATASVASSRGPRPLAAPSHLNHNPLEGPGPLEVALAARDREFGLGGAAGSTMVFRTTHNPLFPTSGTGSGGGAGPGRRE